MVPWLVLENREGLFELECVADIAEDEV